MVSVHIINDQLALCVRDNYSSYCNVCVCTNGCCRCVCQQCLIEVLIQFSESKINYQWSVVIPHSGIDFQLDRDQSELISGGGL